MQSPAYPLEITVGEAQALLATGPDQALVLDVREPGEVAIAHVAGAWHVPMQTVPARISALPRDRHLLVLCHHGVRSLRVTHFLRDQGFTAVSSVAGGIEAWATEIDPAIARY